jgi:hypothetical protein
MDFANSFFILNASPIIPSLRELFPALEYLSLTSSSHSITKEMIQTLPPSLKTLILGKSKYASTFVPLALDAAEMAHLLPPQLEVLDIYSVMVTTPVGHPHQGVWLAGDQLKTLRIRVGDPRLLEALPSTLEVLETWIDHTSPIFLWAASKLPQRLRVLRVVSLQSHGIWLDAPLPNDLEDWDGCVNIGSPMDLMRCLPPTITNWNATTHSSLAVDLGTCLPQLQALNLSQYVDWDEAGPNWAPNNLTKLDISLGDSAVLMSLLPPTLQHLSIPIASESQFMALPRQLKSLKVVAQGNRVIELQGLSRSAWMSLPRTVEHLDIPFEYLFDVKYVGMLPSAIKSLTFSNTPGGLRRDLYEDTTLGFYLPHQLESLSLPSVINSVWRAWVGNLANMSQLHTLNVPIRAVANWDRKTYYDFLKRLPSTLTSLTFPILPHDVQRHIPMLQSLPKGLKSLCLYVQTPITWGWEHLKAMPPRLHTVNIPFIYIDETEMDQPGPLPCRALIFNPHNTQLEKRSPNYIYDHHPMWMGSHPCGQIPLSDPDDDSSTILDA